MCVCSDTCASRKENGIRVCADSEEKLWFTPVRWKQVLGEKNILSDNILATYVPAPMERNLKFRK